MKIYKILSVFSLLITSNCTDLSSPLSLTSNPTKNESILPENLDMGILSGDGHLKNGVKLLNSPNRSKSNIYFARSAFEKSALVKVDDPTPFFLAGYSNYLLGDYPQAYRNFVSAAGLAEYSDGWFLASLSALRAGHELAAQATYNHGRKIGSGRSKVLETYMNELYASTAKNRVKSELASQLQNENFICNDVSDEVLDSVDICSSDIQIEFFIVERRSENKASIGKDIMSGLSLGAGGSIIDYERNLSWEDGSIDARSASLTNGLTIDLSSISYNLSIANDVSTKSFVSSSPILKLRLGEESELAAGETLRVVNLGADGGETEAEMGITISASVSQFTNRTATFAASLELSEFFEPYMNAGAIYIKSDSAQSKTFGTVAYDAGFLVGAVELEHRSELNGGQTGIRKIPVVGNLLGTRGNKTTRREIAVIATIRAPSKINYSSQMDELQRLKVMGVKIPEGSQRQKIIHKAPSLDQILLEMGLFD
jgi:hypothetical protein